MTCSIDKSGLSQNTQSVTAGDPEISIVTPSFNALPYLKKCRESIVDQAGVDAEHIVMDGGSMDGTVLWLESQRGVRFESGPDRGMYDAVNKGMHVARGGILAYLNCDEQYLPGALSAVRDFFAVNPHIDIVFGHILLIRPDGSLIAFRKAYPVRWPFVVTGHLYTLSCGMFFRRRIIDNGIGFDSDLRDVGDADFVVRVLRAGYRAGILPAYVAAFTMTGQNMSAKPNALAEAVRMRAQAPAVLRLLRFPLKICRRLDKFVYGAYHQKFPFTYSIYTAGEESCRRSFTVSTASFRWPK